MHGIIVIINTMAIIMLLVSVVLVDNIFVELLKNHRHANIAGRPKTSISCKSCMTLSEVIVSNDVLVSIL
jgi:hypothetical protein